MDAVSENALLKIAFTIVMEAALIRIGNMSLIKSDTAW